MAATAITNTVLVRNTMATLPATAAVHATDGALVSCEVDDQKLLLIIENASADTAKTATIVKGNGIQGVADYAVSIPAATTKCVVVESGAFKIVKGTNAGKMLIKGTDANIKVAAVVLP